MYVFIKRDVRGECHFAHRLVFRLMPYGKRIHTMKPSGMPCASSTAVTLKSLKESFAISIA